MAEKLDPKDLVTLEELALSNMWEVAGIIPICQIIRIFTVPSIFDRY